MAAVGTIKMGDDFWGGVYWLGHALSPIAIVGTMVGYFPAFASVVALIFYFIQIYESKTCQTWLQTRRLRKIAVLKVAMARLEAQELKALARRTAKNGEDGERARRIAASFTTHNDINGREFSDAGKS